MARATLAPFLIGLQGKLGPVSFSKSKNGASNMKTRVKPANPKTAAQVAVRGAQTKSAQIFKNASAAQVAAWKVYAATLPQISKKTGAKITVQPINAFCGLADKFLQVNPAGTVPMTPPTSAFTGDNITFTATATTGAVTFTASAVNTANVKTELLLQPLKGKNRTPGPKAYRSKMFVNFAGPGLSQAVTVPAGFYAAAYRFVNTVTGQETALVPIAVVTVALSMEDGGAEEAPVSRKKAA